MTDQDITISRNYISGPFPIKITMVHIPTGISIMGTGKQEAKLISDLKVILKEKVGAKAMVEEIHEEEPIIGTIKLRKKWTRKVQNVDH